MVNWLKGIWSTITGGVSSVIQAFVHALVNGIALVLDFIFGNVKGAWVSLVDAYHDIVTGVHTFVSAVWNELNLIITYYIPTYAFTAWWWVTHLDDLALVLLWHVLKWLEHYAWTAALYLGEFILALIVRNIRRIMLLAETIVTAVL